jgi:hypothetical protein
LVFFFILFVWFFVFCSLFVCLGFFFVCIVDQKKTYLPAETVWYGLNKVNMLCPIMLISQFLVENLLCTAFALSNSRRSEHFFVWVTCLNAKTGSGVWFDRDF